MAEEKRKLCIWRGTDICARYSVSACRPCHEYIDHIKFGLWVLPFTAFCEPECEKLWSLCWIAIWWQLWTTKWVSRLRWKECKFGCYASWAWRTAEQAAEFFEWQSIHIQLILSSLEWDIIQTTVHHNSLQTWHHSCIHLETQSQITTGQSHLAKPASCKLAVKHALALTSTVVLMHWHCQWLCCARTVGNIAESVYCEG